MTDMMRHNRRYHHQDAIQIASYYVRTEVERQRDRDFKSTFFCCRKILTALKLTFKCSVYLQKNLDCYIIIIITIDSIDAVAKNNASCVMWSWSYMIRYRAIKSAATNLRVNMKS